MSNKKKIKEKYRKKQIISLLQKVVFDHPIHVPIYFIFKPKNVSCERHVIDVCKSIYVCIHTNTHCVQ